MVFKPFTHLPRQIFSKTFAHGYAQSVVAASQSSYASTTTSLGLNSNYPVGKLGRTAQLQNTYQSASSSSGAGAKAGNAGASNAPANDGGVGAYYTAWQHAQQTGDDSEWRNHQLQKRLGWKGPGASTPTIGRDSNAAADALLVRHPAVPRSRSTSAVHDINIAQDGSDAVENSTVPVHSIEGSSHDLDSENGAKSARPVAEYSAVENSSTTSVAPESTYSTDASSLTSTSETWASLSEHIVQLAKDHHYAEIPAVFQLALSQGIVPSIDAYNALLIAAINVPSDADQAFAKVLDVQGDMIRRGVKANADTYAIMVQFLASRALQAIKSKASLEQSQKRFGGVNGSNAFLFTSNEMEYELLAEDDSLSLAMKQFRTAVKTFPQNAFPAEVYESLIRACAKSYNVDDMCEVYNVMNSCHKVISPDGFYTMIQAFQPSANLGQAVQAYENYKNLALSSNATFSSTRSNKTDFKTYAGLIKSYILAGQDTRGLAFFDEVSQSLEDSVDEASMLSEMQSVVIPEGVISAFAAKKAYQKAFDFLTSAKVNSTITDKSFNEICVAAADSNEVAVAQEAFGALTPAAKEQAAPVMLAMALRGGDLETARAYWQHITGSSIIDQSLLEPATMFTVSLIANTMITEGLSEARGLFAKLRKHAASSGYDIRDEIAEALLKFDQTIMRTGVLPSAGDSVMFLRTMMENETFIPSVAEHNLAPIGPNDIQAFGFEDLKFVLHAQANMMLRHAMVGDNGAAFRFVCLLQCLMSVGKELDQQTLSIIRETLPMIHSIRPDIPAMFEAFVSPVVAAPTPAIAPLASVQTTPADTFDPYARSTDFKGSAIIADRLESSSGRNDNLLNDALSRFKNMRRVGRHPRYITYAKLITAAARAGKRNVVEDVLSMACTDVPYLEQYPVVKHGWVSILDAMVAAYLTLGDRAAAAQIHQDLLAMGAAPSANTFGLYITTLKESTRTFDEATEAVKVFHRAIAEGVEPTSFLYNALIGKLGKARRIDDCLQYFAEMRAHNIRPTSVTYGTIVNALCRVSDERFAEEMFDEMESMPNYKPRPAPYNSMIQYFLNTKRDRGKVMAYYERMKSKGIEPTMHTYKLLVDAYASLEPVDMAAAERIIEEIKAGGQQPEAVHYASLIHAKGCVAHDIQAAREIFNSVLSGGLTQPQACLYQALCEALVANHQVAETEQLLQDMKARNVQMTPYITNTLIHGWASTSNLAKAQAAYDQIGQTGREPSTYEAMTRAYLSVEDHQGAASVVSEMMQRQYPAAVAGKILELVAGGNAPTVAQ